MAPSLVAEFPKHLNAAETWRNTPELDSSTMICHIVSLFRNWEWIRKLDPFGTLIMVKKANFILYIYIYIYHSNKVLKAKIEKRKPRSIWKDGRGQGQRWQRHIKYEFASLLTKYQNVWKNKKPWPLFPGEGKVETGPKNVKREQWVGAVNLGAGAPSPLCDLVSSAVQWTDWARWPWRSVTPWN